jgi:hypothetical protein
MAKLIYVCTRDPKECEQLVKTVAFACGAISPDNIFPHSEKIFAEDGIVFGVTNPSATIRINGKSVVIGKIDDPSDRWALPGTEIPDGNFAVIRGDNDSVELISDAVGSRTIWYYKDDRIFIASTSQRAIISILGSFQLDERAISWVLSTGTLGPSFSWDRRLIRVSVDSLVKISRSSWKLTTASKSIEFDALPISDSGHEELLESTIDAAFKAINVDLSNWVLPLSGGYDSRAILCYLLKNIASERELKCITWGVESALTEKGNDAFIAKSLAAHFNITHSFYQMDLSVEAPKKILDRFILNGEGRIDHLAGYMDGFQLWKALFEHGVQGVIRGDEAFGWLPVSSPEEVLRLAGIQLCSDFSNLKNCDEFQLPDQEIPSNLWRRDTESLPTWRDRLYQEHRIPVLLAALSDLKAPYLELMNPLLSKRILAVVRRLPDHLRTDKVLFKKLVSRISPRIGFAKTGANAAPEEILRKSEIVEILRNELKSGRAELLVPLALIDNVLRNIHVSDGPAKPKHQSLAGRLKDTVPSSIKEFLRRKGIKPLLDWNILAFRIYLISRMNAVLTADAKPARK